MSINASRFYGIGLSFLAVGAFAACSSTDDGATGNTAGSSTNHAGTASLAGNTSTGGNVGAGGTTGSSGTGTSGSSTAGTSSAGAATGGSGGGSSAACAGTKPTSALITEFADLTPNAMSAGQFLFTLGVPGGTFAYQPMVFTLTDASKSLNIKGNVKNYDGFGVYTTACTDASAYTGVSFSIKGNAGPAGTLNFRVQTNADMPVDAVNKKGACVVPSGTTDTYPLCHPSSKDIMVSADAKTIEVKFSDLAGGVPVAAVSAKDVVGFEWAFSWTGASDTPYDADITIDDLKFTGGSTGGSSNGGSGGSSNGGSAGSSSAGGGMGGSGGTQ
jgi:hypothetical protein